MQITDLYHREWNTDGLLIAIYKIAEDGTKLQLHFYAIDTYDENNNLIAEAKTFDESHHLTIELRENEALYGTLDLSDKPPEEKNKGKKKD